MPVLLGNEGAPLHIWTHTACVRACMLVCGECGVCVCMCTVYMYLCSCSHVRMCVSPRL